MSDGQQEERGEPEHPTGEAAWMGGDERSGVMGAAGWSEQLAGAHGPHHPAPGAASVRLVSRTPRSPPGRQTGRKPVAVFCVGAFAASRHRPGRPAAERYGDDIARRLGDAMLLRVVTA